MSKLCLFLQILKVKTGNPTASICLKKLKLMDPKIRLFKVELNALPEQLQLEFNP